MSFQSTSSRLEGDDDDVEEEEEEGGEEEAQHLQT
jgi:hypothetical protein